MLRATLGCRLMNPARSRPYQHLVNRRWADPKVLPQVGLRRRPAVQASVGVDIRKILVLFGREVFCRATHFGHSTQQGVWASRRHR